MTASPSKPFALFPGLCLGLLALLSAPTAGQAHSEATAEARIEVTIGPDRSVSSVRHLWRFDDHFSADVLQEFDADGDGSLNERESEDLSETMFSSLSESHFLQFVAADGADVPMAPPAKVLGYFEDKRLVLLFESRPAQTLRLGAKTEIGVFDPSLSIAFVFAKQGDISVTGLPANCTSKVFRPDPETVMAQDENTLTPLFQDPSGRALAHAFGTRLEISCGS